MSPYSRFGYGLLSEQANAAQRAMGGVGYAMRSGREVNFMNPASYAAIDSLTFLFDMALNVKALRTTEGDLKGKNFTGGLDYITLQFPVTKWGGACIGLAPYSEVGYSFGSEIVNGQSAREGSGSLNQLFLGLSARPLPGLTVGANIGYLFGTLLNDNYVTVSGTSSVSLFERVMEVRDYNLRFGVQYAVPINRENEVSLGVVYTPKKSLRGHAYGVKYDVNADTKPDTIGYMNLRGNYGTPETWGVGVAYKWNNRLNVEVDATYQPWSKVAFAPIKGFDPEGQDVSFNNRYKIALGASYMPNFRGNYFQRISYRLGGSYCRDYIRARGNQVKETGLTLGLGLPAPSSKTVVNLSFEWKHRQASPVALVKENYYMVTLGLNFNEMWFWRNKLR